MKDTRASRYYWANRDKILEANKLWREANDRSEYFRRYHEKNREARNAAAKNYYYKNRKVILKKQKISEKYLIDKVSRALGINFAEARAKLGLRRTP